jgi:glycosyltransferase involved in cell wall biosynthesis
MDPGHARSLQHQASRPGLAQRVRFCGKLEDGELVALMKSSHVLVVPSSYEGYGIVYLEGMGSGLPAIATTGGAAGEIITPGQDGYLVAPGDATALAGCIARLAQDRELLVRMSQAARRRYDRHPTWEASMQAIHQFLRLIANHKDSHEPYRNGTN